MVAEAGFEPGKQGNSNIPKTKSSDGNPAGNAVAEIVADFRGNYPATWYLDWTGLVGAADQDVLYASSDVSMYNEHSVENASGVTVDVFASVDGINFSVQPQAVLVASDTDPTILKTSIINNRTATFKGKFKAIEVRQAAAGAITAGDVRGAHSVS